MEVAFVGTGLFSELVLDARLAFDKEAQQRGVKGASGSMPRSTARRRRRGSPWTFAGEHVAIAQMPKARPILSMNLMRSLSMRSMRALHSWRTISTRTLERR